MERVFGKDNPELATMLRANVSRFSAYKAYQATQEIRSEISNTGDIDAAKKIINKYNRYQAAEYNTAISRSRTAKQWAEWDNADDNRLFPNIMWLPSRSAQPREEHMPFYGRIWPKNDPFWNENQPGNLWNCKCDWQQVDDPPTQNNPQIKAQHQGLEGNPAKTGEIFSDKCSHVKNAPTHVEADARKIWREYPKNVALSSQKKHIPCQIGGNTIIIDLGEPTPLKHFSRDLYKSDLYWVKNTILLNQSLLKNSQYVGYKAVDLNHNSNSRTLAFKKKIDFFYYYKVSIGEKELFLHFCHYKDTGNISPYAASTQPPKNIIAP